MSDRIKLTQVWLGARPYVLIEAKFGPDGEDDLRLVITSGGGPQSAADVAGFLAMALADMPSGLDLMRTAIEEYGDQE